MPLKPLARCGALPYSFLLVILFAAGCGGPSAVDGDSSAYVGQPVPGAEPRLFAPGVVNTGMATRDLAMTPDGREIYFCMVAPGYRYTAICVTRLEDGRWTEPEVAPFAADPRWMDVEPFITPDGRQFFFCSNRPTDPEGDGNIDLWVMDRQGDQWGSPRNVGEPVSTGAQEYFPSVTEDGTLYFCRAVPPSRIHHIYRSRRIAGVYQEPELLPEAINAGQSQFNSWTSPDESRCIVPIAGHPQNLGGVDYWLALRDADDQWSGPLNLGPVVNDGSSHTWSPYVSPDGRFFFFMSARQDRPEQWPETWRGLQDRHLRPGGGRPAMYWMNAAFLDSLAAGVEVVAPVEQPGSAPSGGESGPRFPRLSGPYLGQEAPGRKPRIFAPGIVSTGLNERDIVISPNGNEIYFGVMDLGRVTVLVTRLEQDQWTEPVTVPFHGDGDFACFEPTLSRDGDTVLFLANRAAPGQEQGRGWANQNIFTSRRTTDGWSEAVALPAPVTSDLAEYFPSLADDGTLYFSREDEQHGVAIWRSEPVGDSWSDPVRLGPEVNCGPNNYNAFVARDESLLIICVGGHPENLGPADYWVSFRSDDGSWLPAVNLGPQINRAESRASSAFLTADGKYLFFSASRHDQSEFFPEERLDRAGLLRLHESPGNGASDIWWVDAGLLDDLRP